MTALPVIAGAARLCGRLQQREGCVVSEQNTILQPTCAIRDEVSSSGGVANVSVDIPNTDDVNTDVRNEAVSAVARDVVDNNDETPSLSIHDNLVSTQLNNHFSPAIEGSSCSLLESFSESMDFLYESVDRESHVDAYEQLSPMSSALFDSDVGGSDHDQGAPELSQEAQ
ncbi:hypothetical protein V6N13_109521 [Hibiscus sabdariffa]|uniref:Uncharacterized protein n=1 Tax=Hibiscus sabdariffa TaxID=183260 RepID=A0ABR2FPZ0_9ROSI